MSYTKPVKQCGDAPMGINTVNAVVDSQTEMRAVLETEHVPQLEPPVVGGFGHLGGGQVSVSTLNVLVGGAHDTPKVARGTMRIDTVDAYAIGSASMKVGYRTGVCREIQRIQTGCWFLPIIGLVDFYAEVSASQDDPSAAREVSQTPFSADGVPAGIFIYCWEEQTLNSSELGMTLADYSFSVVVFGRKPEPNTEVAPVVAQASPAQHAYRHGLRRPHSRVFKPA